MVVDMARKGQVIRTLLGPVALQIPCSIAIACKLDLEISLESHLDSSSRCGCVPTNFLEVPFDARMCQWGSKAGGSSKVEEDSQTHLQIR